MKTLELPETTGELTNPVKQTLYDGEDISKMNSISNRFEQMHRADEANFTYSAIFAASCGDLAELRRLASYGHNMDYADCDGFTPLHLAATEGHIEVVSYLLFQGVSTNPINRFGNTPLNEAIRHNRNEVIMILSEPDNEVSTSIAA